MRIDQVGGQKPMPQPQQQNANAARTESTVQVQSIKTVKAETSLLKQQKANSIEAEMAAEKKAAQNEQEVISAIEKANKQFRTYDRRLEFSIHERTKEIMVKVINMEDDSVIREIPSEKVLDMVAHMWEIAGLIVDEYK